jgi:hypothetical protein
LFVVNAGSGPFDSFWETAPVVLDDRQWGKVEALLAGERRVGPQRHEKEAHGEFESEHPG